MARGLGGTWFATTPSFFNSAVIHRWVRFGRAFSFSRFITVWSVADRMLRESGEQTVAQRVEGVQRACGQQGAEGVHQLLCRSKAQLARFNIVPLCRRAH